MLNAITWSVIYCSLWLEGSASNAYLLSREVQTRLPGGREKAAYGVCASLRTAKVGDTKLLLPPLTLPLHQMWPH